MGPRHMKYHFLSSHGHVQKYIHCKADHELIIREVGTWDLSVTVTEIDCIAAFEGAFKIEAYLDIIKVCDFEVTIGDHDLKASQLKAQIRSHLLRNKAVTHQTKITLAPFSLMGGEKPFRGNKVIVQGRVSRVAKEMKKKALNACTRHMHRTDLSR